MPSPSVAENTTRSAAVAAINTVNAPDGVLSHALALRRSASQARGAIRPRLAVTRFAAAGTLTPGPLAWPEVLVVRSVVLDQQAAIHGQRDPGDHARPVTRQKQDRIGDVFGFAHASERDFPAALGLGLGARQRPAKGGCGGAGTDSVDADVVGSELVGS